MEEVLDILKYVVPSVVVFVAVYFVMKKFMDNEHRRLMIGMRKGDRKVSLPIRLQAYERTALLVERIDPKNLVMRIHKSGMSARVLQAELLKHIRSEYEHNVSQQIYVSESVWQAVKTTKEENIRLINTAVSKIKDDASGLELSKVILAISQKMEKNPNDLTLRLIKKEVKKVF